MKALNRNISGLNTIYEIHLKGISGQLDTLDQINKGLIRIKEMYEGSVPDSSIFSRETEKMTRQIQELNQIYGRLIHAMTNTQPK
jgi:gliding motility-associated protein GldL